jgi:hypothetical protein
VATVPDKRNPSKQRRQARNRASRDSLAARRENAITAASAPPSARPGSTPRAARATTGGAARRGASSRPARPTAIAAGPPPAGFGEYVRSTRTGDRLILLAFALALAGALALLFIPAVRVDDRGDPIPLQFGALTIMARQAVTGNEDVADDVWRIDAYGAAAVLMAVVPLLIAGYAVWANRRPDRARLLTFALIAMVFAALFTGGLVLLLPAVIVLGVASFRIRKADMEAGMAAAPPSGGFVDADVVDGSGAPERPRSLLQRLLGPGAATGGPGRTATGEAAPGGPDTGEPDPVIEVDEAAPPETTPDTGAAEAPDPLAELEAELAAEAEADRPTRDGGDAPSGERRRRE